MIVSALCKRFRMRRFAMSGAARARRADMGENRLPERSEIRSEFLKSGFFMELWPILQDLPVFSWNSWNKRKNISTNNADPASPATSPNTASDTVTGIRFSMQTDTSRNTVKIRIVCSKSYWNLRRKERDISNRIACFGCKNERKFFPARSTNIRDQYWE